MATSQDTEKDSRQTRSKKPIELEPKVQQSGFVRSERIEDENLTKPDLLAFLKGIVRARGIAGHHIDSMNVFYEEGIDAIIKRGFSIESSVKNKRTGTAGSEADITEINFHLNFLRATLQKPVMQESSLDFLPVADRAAASSAAAPLGTLYPAQARRLMRTYSAQIRVDAEVSATAHHAHGAPEVRTALIKDCRIGAIPCMVKTKFCNLYGMSRQELIMHEEDPNDDGGYLIIRGGEHSIDCIENITTNDIRITTEAHKRETAHVQIWSKFGDGFESSYQFVVHQMADGSIMIEPQFFSLTEIQIPFYVFFRLIADINDREIAECIVGDLNSRDALTTAMITLLNSAFMAPVVDQHYRALRNEMSHAEVARIIGEHLLDLSQNALAVRDENVVRAAYTKMMDQIDTRVLPHLGRLPTDRPKKIRYIGYVIYKMFLTILGVLDPLDRDSLRNKRMHAAGIAVSKSFKTMFSHTITTPIRHQLVKAFDSSPFNQVNMVGAVISAIKPGELENDMMKAMTMGNTEVKIGRNVTMNRVSSQVRYLKNDLNGKSIANTIAVANVLTNKRTDRADQIRRVHPTYVGYIDISQSADTGEKVGMNKQITVSAIISLATDSANLKKIIYDEEKEHLIHWDQISATEIKRQRLSSVFVNGDWIGCVAHDWEFVRRWRMFRREHQLIHRHTSIYWDPSCREVLFWTDFGRMLRPLIIVYNNLDEYNERCLEARDAGLPAPPREEFVQWTRLTRDVIAQFMRGEVDMKWLQDEGIIEYIAADECENMFVAPSIDEIHDRRHDICSRYTHCDIEQAIYGIVTLASPLTNHSYAVRTTYYVNQRKQSCTWYSLAYPYRTDKKTMMQYYCEKPIVSCFTDDFCNPNGHNCLVAIMVHTGYNQEDSMFINASSVQRGMFNGAFFDYESTVCEHGEVFMMPENRVVIDRHSDAITDFLDNGVARVGTIIKRNYVLIHKVASVVTEGGARGREAGEQRFIDRSIIYMSRTPAYVMHVERGEDDRKMKFIRVKYRQVKNIIRGDKCSSRTGNKGIVSRLLAACDMPFTEDGLVPDIVINPQSIPTRRALNQIIESVLGQYGAVRGCHVDATSMMPIDVEAVIEELHQFGFKHVGYRRMYNGTTGDWLDLPICIGPTTYQRLEKFVDNECRATKYGHVDTVTRQPVRGGVEKGALRIGEMEGWSMVGHGSMRSLAEKLVTDSDGTILHICRRCGNIAIFNARIGLYGCRTCGQFAQIVRVPSTWASNLMREEVRTLGIKMQFELEPHKYFVSQEPNSDEASSSGK